MLRGSDDDETDQATSARIASHQSGETTVLRLPIARKSTKKAWGDTLILSMDSLYENSEREGSIVKMQSWWRMKRARSTYHERLQSVHIVTFVIGLLIRLAVLAYLIAMLYSVASVIDDQNAETSSPANAENMESSVLYELLTTESAGENIIVACRCGFGA